MIQVAKRTQFLSPGADFSLSSLSSAQKSKILSIHGVNATGMLTKWSPESFFPALASLLKDASYMIRSVFSSGSFVPYELPIVAGGLPEHDDQIVKSIQFFTYRGESNFSLAQLSSGVKARILRINAEGPLPSSDLLTWTPGQLFPSFGSFVTGRTYVVESISSGFSAYRLGVPDPPSEALSFLNDSLIPDIGLMPAEYLEV